MPILYKENTLQLSITRKSELRPILMPRLHVLDWTMKLGRLDGPYTEPEELLRHAELQAADGADNDDAGAIAMNHETLRSFKNYDLQIQMLNDYDMHNSCCILRELLANKHVTVSISETCSRYSWSTKEERLDMFKCFRGMRCSSISFIGYEDNTQDLVNLIQSGKLVVDTMAWYRQFGRDVLDQLPLTESEETFEDAGFDNPGDRRWEVMGQMRQAAARYDVVAYTQHKNDLTDLVIDFLAQTYDHWARNVRSQSRWLVKRFGTRKEKSEEGILEYEKRVPKVLEEVQKQIDKIKYELVISKARGSDVTDPKLFDRLKRWLALTNMWADFMDVCDVVKASL